VVDSLSDIGTAPQDVPAGPTPAPFPTTIQALDVYGQVRTGPSDRRDQLLVYSALQQARERQV